ncbi:MAG: precorrin-6y C5,15-methyltransferase (decarboxylating) subunit CbiE [Candidatus Magnetoovum sp. WYHC-5]|nr:precorrin-6y C5,15-methyltransferase (decarboxylating) subunit CbiE [Candidatus Magnetoovum sp. WYHC-5]
MYRIRIISVGPGGKELITLEALRVIGECEVVIARQEQIEIITTEVTQKVFVCSKVDEILTIVEANEGYITGLLVTGDAGLYSLSNSIMKKLGKDSIEQIVCGVSSVQVAFAKVCEPWVNVRVVSFHGRDIENLQDVFKHEKVAILCDKVNDSKVILKALDTEGLWDRGMRVFVCQNLTMESEQVLEITNSAYINYINPARKEILLLLTI